MLDYNASVPTGYYFLAHYLESIEASQVLRHLAFFYAERNLQEYDTLNVLPHHFCAAALYAAMVQQNQYSKKAYATDCWPHVLEEESGLREADLGECVYVCICIRVCMRGGVGAQGGRPG